jgi:hypothetical protein
MRAGRTRAGRGAPGPWKRRAAWRAPAATRRRASAAASKSPSWIPSASSTPTGAEAVTRSSSQGLAAARLPRSHSSPARPRCPRRDAYTCWSTASGARVNNFGARIDYVLAADGSPEGHAQRERAVAELRRRSSPAGSAVAVAGSQSDGTVPRWPPCPAWVVAAVSSPRGSTADAAVLAHAALGCLRGPRASQQVGRSASRHCRTSTCSGPAATTRPRGPSWRSHRLAPPSRCRRRRPRCAAATALTAAVRCVPTHVVERLQLCRCGALAYCLQLPCPSGRFGCGAAPCLTCAGDADFAAGKAQGCCSARRCKLCFGRSGVSGTWRLGL